LFDKRGERARQAAEGTSEKLADQPADAPGASALADPFMFQDYYGDRSPEQVANVFGAKLPGPYSSSSRARGKGPSNPGSAGIWSGWTP